MWIESHACPKAGRCSLTWYLYIISNPLRVGYVRPLHNKSSMGTYFSLVLQSGTVLIILCGFDPPGCGEVKKIHKVGVAINGPGVHVSAQRKMRCHFNGDKIDLKPCQNMTSFLQVSYFYAGSTASRVCAWLIGSAVHAIEQRWLLQRITSNHLKCWGKHSEAITVVWEFALFIPIGFYLMSFNAVKDFLCPSI